MTSNYKLSICIPTHNRAAYIGETLASIISQSGDDIEIVIVDGASSDNTADVVNEFQGRFENIHYHREKQNNGIDADLAKSVALAQGEYCWLMSSDDILAAGAIQRILTEIKEGMEIYLCNIIACTKDMIPVRDLSWFSPKIADRVFDFSRKEVSIEYLVEAKSIGALFSYMPAVIVRRADWMSVNGAEEFFGSCYAHVFTLFSIIQKKCKLKYINVPPLVLTRYGNDSFSQRGFVNRLLIDFDGYIRISDKFFSEDNHAKKAFLKVMTREHPWYRILKLRSNALDEIEWRKIRTLLSIIGYSNSVILICGFFGRFRNMISFLVRLKRIVKSL